MIYEYVCRTCVTIEERTMTVAEFDHQGRDQRCLGCHEILTLRVTGGRKPFVRSPFPKGFSEHISPDGHYIRDKIEAREIAAENELTSVAAENFGR